MLARNLYFKYQTYVQILTPILAGSLLSFWIPGSLADTNIYYRGGEKILFGRDAYNGELPLFSAPAGSVSVYLLGKLLFIENYPLIWQVVNLFGLFFFFSFVLWSFNIKKNQSLVASLLILSSPVREMVVNNQVTGLALGTASVALYFSFKSQSMVVTIISFLPLYLVFELKPNLILGLLLYFLYKNRHSLKTLLPLFFGQIFGLTILIGPKVYYDWLNFILTRGTENLTGYESLGISTFLYESDLLDLNSARVFGISLYVLTLFFALKILFFSKNEFQVAILPILVLMFPYIHYLDFISAVPFVYLLFLRRDWVATLAPTATALLYLPQPSQSVIKNLAIFVILLSIATLQIYSKLNGFWVITGFFLGLSLILSNFWLGMFVLDAHTTQVITVVRSWLFISFALFLSLLKSSGGIQADQGKERKVS